jgi:hypothetical protein
LVKNYPLYGDRGTVVQWLQYAFNASAGEGSKEEWTAGALDKTTYLVQYRFLPGRQTSIQEAISYLFEADTARKTVKGSNPAARELLGGALPSKPKRPRISIPQRQRLIPKKEKAEPRSPLKPASSELAPPGSGRGGVL